MDINGGSWYINVIHLYHSFNTMHFISTGIDIHMVIPPTNIMHTNIHIYTYIYNNIHIYINGIAFTLVSQQTLVLPLDTTGY